MLLLNFSNVIFHCAEHHKQSSNLLRYIGLDAKSPLLHPTPFNDSCCIYLIIFSVHLEVLFLHHHFFYRAFIWLGIETQLILTTYGNESKAELSMLT